MVSEITKSSYDLITTETRHPKNFEALGINPNHPNSHAHACSQAPSASHAQDDQDAQNIQHGPDAPTTADNVYATPGSSSHAVSPHAFPPRPPQNPMAMHPMFTDLLAKAHTVEFKPDGTISLTQRSPSPSSPTPLPQTRWHEESSRAQKSGWFDNKRQRAIDHRARIEAGTLDARPSNHLNSPLLMCVVCHTSQRGLRCSNSSCSNCCRQFNVSCDDDRHIPAAYPLSQFLSRHCG
jgi:hypothetical protein